jgi:hypothetical protein
LRQMRIGGHTRDVKRRWHSFTNLPQRERPAPFCGVDAHRLLKPLAQFWRPDYRISCREPIAN